MMSLHNNYPSHIPTQQMLPNMGISSHVMTNLATAAADACSPTHYQIMLMAGGSSADELFMPNNHLVLANFNNMQTNSDACLSG